MYKKIQYYGDFDALLEKVGFFQDSLLREIEIISRGYVSKDNKMFGDIDPYDMRMIFHSQYAGGCCIDIIFHDVIKYSFIAAYEIVVNLDYDENDTVIYLSQPGTQARSFVKCKSLQYRVHRSGLLGRKLLLGSPIPTDNSCMTSVLDDTWLQCDSCSDAWEANLTQEFTQCPSCGLIYVNPLFSPKKKQGTDYD
jgi:hypothetical protein